MIKEYDIKTALSVFPWLKFPSEIVNDENYIVRADINNGKIDYLEFGYPEDVWLLEK